MEVQHVTYGRMRIMTDSFVFKITLPRACLCFGCQPIREEYFQGEKRKEEGNKRREEEGKKEKHKEESTR